MHKPILCNVKTDTFPDFSKPPKSAKKVSLQFCKSIHYTILTLLTDVFDTYFLTNFYVEE